MTPGKITTPHEQEHAGSKESEGSGFRNRHETDDPVLRIEHDIVLIKEGNPTVETAGG